MKSLDLYKAIVEHKYCSLLGRKIRLNGNRSYVKLSFPTDKGNIIEITRLRGAKANIIINGNNYILSPIKPTLIEIDSKEFIINMPPDAIGHIIISGIFIKDDNVVIEKKDVIISNNSELFLSRLGKGIKKTDNGIFASEYSEIEREEDILSIETDPPNAWIRKNGKITFICPCRIFGVNINDVVNFSNVVPESIKEKMEEVIVAKNEAVSAPTTPIIEQTKVVVPNLVKEVILQGQIEPVASSLIKCTKSAGSIIMTSIGKFIIPLVTLEPNTEYSVGISTRRLNGNGKLGFEFINNSGFVYNSFVQNTDGISTKIITKSRSVGETYAISLFRPPKMSTGSIVVSDIKICKISTINTINTITKKIIEEKPVINPCFYSSSNNDNVDNSIKESFKQFSILTLSETEFKLPISGSVGITDFYSRLWYSRAGKSFTDLKYFFREGIAFYNSKSFISADVQLGSIDSFRESERLYIKEFPNNTIINEEQAKIFQKCSKILTPSFTNKFNIEKVAPNINIELCCLPWPYIPSNYTKKDYYIYFEEDEFFTNKLVSAWKLINEKLYVVGSNMTFPTNIKHIPYLSQYKELVKYVAEAKGLIYISNNNHHYSGLINLALACNTPIATNNHQYLNEGIIIRNDISERVISEDIYKSAKSLIDIKTNFSINEVSYNELVIKNINIVLGKTNA